MSLFRVTRTVQQVFEVDVDDEEEARYRVENYLPLQYNETQIGDFTFRLRKKTPPFAYSMESHIHEEDGFNFHQDCRVRYDLKSNYEMLGLLAMHGGASLANFYDPESSCFWATFDTKEQAAEFIEVMNKIHTWWKEERRTKPEHRRAENATVRH